MTAPFAKPQAMHYVAPQTEALVRMFERANERERAMLGEMHEHYEAEVRRMVYEGEQPQNIAHTLHTIIDRDVANTLKRNPNGHKVQCARGCAHCCHLHVNVTSAEAMLLAGVVAMEGIPVDWRKVQRQAGRDLNEWNAQPLRERRCAFLGDDDACMVYDYRPAACRKYQVINKPKLCDTVRFPHGQVAILTAPEAEVVTSAALTVLASGSLPRMVLAAKERHDEQG